MHRFLYPGKMETNSEVELSPEESRHAASVLRLKPGDEVELVNGMGTVAKGSIREVKNRRVTVGVQSTETFEPSFKIHLCFALPKGHAIDFIYRRCTELGVASFQPLLTEHSLQTKEWNEDRWLKVVAEVGKQCQSPFFPKVYPPKRILEWEKTREGSFPIFLSDENHRQEREEMQGGGEGLYLLVGSEGGWSSSERVLFDRLGVTLLGLGSNRLRAETACLVALTLLKKHLTEL